MSRIRLLWLVACISLCALIVLCVMWEGVAHPQGSWKTLKALPLLLPLRGILHGKRYTFQWSSMLVLFYMAEGATRLGDPAPAGELALLEIVLAGLFFIVAVLYARLTAPSRQTDRGGAS